jgi:FkbM family methyltransferase
MKRLRDLMTGVSWGAYLLWRLAGLRRSLTVKLSSGEKFVLRAEPATDMATAFEVFVAEVYHCPQPLQISSVKRIVDVGANVGYTCIYWTRKYPEAQIEAFEPHPAHVNLIHRNLDLNHIKCVTLHAAAAFTEDGQAMLTDAENCSTIVAGGTENLIPVPTVDFFSTVKEKPIDVLKIDIEGGEYSLLKDQRFAGLKVRCLVLEWHVTDEYPQGREWCINRLSELGYSVSSGKFDGPDNGLLWAFPNHA